MKANPNILVVESDPSRSQILQEKVRGLGFKLCSTAPPDRSAEQLASLSPDLAIIGPSVETQTCLKNIHNLGLIDPVMPILTSCEEALLLNGSDHSPSGTIHHLSPDPDLDEISRAIHKAWKQRAARGPLDDSPVVIVGQSPQLMNIREKIRKVAHKDVTVLITGETGTGKELIARSIHYHSYRRKGALVKVNCGALPDDLLESEVFGFQRGAFTGAHKDKPGRLQLAAGGTLFIDEIGDLSLSLQVKLLQIFEGEAFSPLGGTEDEAMDIRVLAATNSDLQQKVLEGSFRKDLFYRLKVVAMDVPSLRTRKEDIPFLTHYFMNKYCFELRKGVMDIPDEIAELFLAYEWPGNVRELENVIRRAIVLRSWDFAFKDLNLHMGVHSVESGSLSEVESQGSDWRDDKLSRLFRDNDFSLKKISKAYVSQAEREAILNALSETQWNRRQAARLLQVSYKTLLNRIKEFDLKP
ncbi:MAG: sigma-54 dependent transcriptional regulator [Thermodesulfobacteriota bacterium]|nr:sigma-54 dependent transcriptional regulator [Thermodesulfobacteriota bacterium]